MDFNFNDQSEEDPYMEPSESDSEQYSDDTGINYMELLNYNAFKLVNKPPQDKNNQKKEKEQLQVAGPPVINVDLESDEEDSKYKIKKRTSHPSNKMLDFITPNNVSSSSFKGKDVIDLVSSDTESSSDLEIDHPKNSSSTGKTNESIQEKVEEIELEMTKVTGGGLKVTQSDVERISGAGKRYFTTERTIICFLCNQKGHDKSECQYSEKCFKCGEAGHTKDKCPELMCFNCKKTGHMSMDCIEAKTFDNCPFCGSKNHLEETCSHVWRQYNIVGLPKVKKPIIKFCYNCAEDHFGDDCPDLINHKKSTSFRELDNIFALTQVKPFRIVEHVVEPGQPAHAYFTIVIPGTRDKSNDFRSDRSSYSYNRDRFQPYGNFSHRSGHSNGYGNQRSYNSYQQTNRNRDYSYYDRNHDNQGYGANSYRQRQSDSNNSYQGQKSRRNNSSNEDGYGSRVSDTFHGFSQSHQRFQNGRYNGNY